MFARIRAVSSYLPAKTEKNSDFVNERFREKLGIVDRHIAAGIGGRLGFQGG